MADHVSLFRSSLLAFTSCYSGGLGSSELVRGYRRYAAAAPCVQCNGVRGRAAAVSRRGGAVPGARPRQRDAEPVPHPRRARRRHRHRRRHRGVARPARRSGGGGRPPRDHPQRRALRARPRRRHGRVRAGRVHQDGGAVRASPRPSRSRRAAARRHRGRHVRAAMGGRRRQPEGPAGVRPLAAQRHHVLRALPLRPVAHGRRYRRWRRSLLDWKLHSWSEINQVKRSWAHTHKQEHAKPHPRSILPCQKSTVCHLHLLLRAREQRHGRSPARTPLPGVLGWPLHPLHGTGICRTPRRRGGGGRRRRRRRTIHGMAGRAAGGLGAVRLPRELPLGVTSPARRDRHWPRRQQGHVLVGTPRRHPPWWTRRRRRRRHGGAVDGPAEGAVPPFRRRLLNPLRHELDAGGGARRRADADTPHSVRPADRRPARRRRVEDRVRSQGERRRRRCRREGGDRRGGEEADGFRCGGGGGRGEGDEEESFADARGLSRCGSSGWFFLQRHHVSDQLYFRVQELKLVCLKLLVL